MQMNLFALMEAIYVKQLLNPGSSGQLALMWALVYVANKCRWKEWFTVPSITLMNLTGLSRQGILKARNQLRQRGLIDYRERGTKASTYRLTVFVHPKEGRQLAKATEKTRTFWVNGQKAKGSCNDAGSQAQVDYTFTFPAAKPGAGVAVSGTIKSYNPGNATTIQLM